MTAANAGMPSGVLRGRRRARGGEAATALEAWAGVLRGEAAARAEGAPTEARHRHSAWRCRPKPAKKSAGARTGGDRPAVEHAIRTGQAATGRARPCGRSHSGQAHGGQTSKAPPGKQASPRGDTPVEHQEGGRLGTAGNCQSTSKARRKRHRRSKGSGTAPGHVPAAGRMRRADRGSRGRGRPPRGRAPPAQRASSSPRDLLYRRGEPELTSAVARWRDRAPGRPGWRSRACPPPPKALAHRAR